MENINHKFERPVSAELFNPTTDQWDKIKDRIWELLKINVDPLGIPLENNPDFAPKKLKAYFEDPKSLVVLLKEARKIIGFSFAIPDADDKEDEEFKTAVIFTTKIDPNYQGKGLVGVIMDRMEKILKKRGYTFIIRNARVSNGYADKIARHYADRIVTQLPNAPEQKEKYGDQVFFRIKL
jgi:ribosomal protein S18 acetylase RimI-like enzyme